MGALGRLSQDSPDLALRFDPLNVDARVAAINAAILQEDLAPIQLSELEARTRSAIALDPVDARLRSLLGEIDTRLDRPAAAEQQFLAAHRISKTEQLALRRLIVASLETRDTAAAIRYLDLFFRRWPDQFQDTAVILPALLRDEAAYKQTLDALEARPPWRSSLIRALSRSEEGLPFSRRLLLDLSTGSATPSAGELNLVVSALLSAGDYEGARRFFLFTLPDQDWNRAGLVFNPRFEAGAVSRSFDWTFRNTAAAYLDASSTPPQNGMTVRFLDKPARDINLQQVLVLDPGRYRLNIEMSAASLKIPKGLYWRLRCARGKEELAQLNIVDGTYRNSNSAIEFTVHDCPAQVLELRSGLNVDSWLYRYSGRITFHEVSVEQIDGSGQSG